MLEFTQTTYNSVTGEPRFGRRYHAMFGQRWGVQLNPNFRCANRTASFTLLSIPVRNSVHRHDFYVDLAPSLRKRMERQEPVCGSVDVPLTEEGESEATRGGELIAAAGILPDRLHTSLLRRVIHTAQIGLAAADREWIPVERSWRLKQRHCGEGCRAWTKPRSGTSSAASSSGSGAAPRLTPTEARPRAESLEDVLRAPLLVRQHRPRPPSRQSDPGRRPRQLAPGQRETPRPDRRRRSRRPQHPPASPGLRPRRRLKHLPPAAATFTAAIEAVKNQSKR